MLSLSTLPVANLRAEDAAQTHWAYAPLQVPAIPEVADKSWCRNPIDNFILQKLNEQSLSPNPEADKRTLIRRLTYDLHGLPPTVAEIDAFLGDASEQAYENLLDRLLSSPRYGERWGRHWLDVVHYGETHGFDKDQRRENAWPYRDYVIQAFNEDKPYSRFIEEQIAGDVLYPELPGIIATGFLSAGPWDLVGQAEVRENTLEKARVRNLDRDDMLGNVFNTFQSTTMQCARCHNHKFDPISQKEYYSLQAVFAGVDRADCEYETPALHVKREKLQKHLGDLKNQQEIINSKISDLNLPELANFEKQEESTNTSISALENEKPDKADSNGFHSNIFGKADEIQWVQIALADKKAIEKIILFPARPVDFPDTPGFGFPLRFQVSISNNENFEEHRIILDSTKMDYPNPGDQPVEIDAGQIEARYVRITATQLWKRTDDFVFALAELQVWQNDQNLALHQQVSASTSIEGGLWSAKNLVDGYDNRKQLDVVTPNEKLDTTQELLSLKKKLHEISESREIFLKDRLEPKLFKEYSKLKTTIHATDLKLNRLPKPNNVYAIKSVPPREISIFLRGSESTPGEKVSPDYWKIFPSLAGNFANLDPSNEGAARTALAHWIASPDNPLTWRSIVNRVWQYHFGRGIVETPNDFGKMGAAPTHPELLDWLATEFRDNLGMFKPLHKIILMSATYRQSSANNEANVNLDASNRYLWRANRYKQDADSFRDSILQISGALDLKMGGPSVDLFEYTYDHSPRYDYTDFNKPEVCRRSVYRSIVRSVPDPFMEALDCADPNISTPVRNTTLTATQALATLNDAFILNQAKHYAETLRGVSDNLDIQLKTAFIATFGRTPSAKEHQISFEYAEKHGLENALRVFWNCNEFMFIN